MSTSIINLESLLELGARLSESSNDEFILNSALLSLMGKMRIIRTCALLPHAGIFTVAMSKGRMALTEISEFHVSELRELSDDSLAETSLIEQGFCHVLPIRYHDELFAVICLGSAANSLGNEELRYISLVGTITANAMQNVRAKRSLLQANEAIEARNQILTALFETAREFSALLHRDEIIRMLSYRLMGQTMVNRFALLIQNSMGLYESAINRLNYDLPQELIKEFLHLNTPIIADQHFDLAEVQEFLVTTKLHVVLPMTVHGQIKGLLLVCAKLNGFGFTPNDLHFMESLGNTAIAALENARLFAEEVEKRRIEGELALAKDIQRQLLPKELPILQRYDIAGENISSLQVGGDYFDIIALDEYRLLIAIADVSGKGIPAALIMANVQAALRALSPLNLPISELVTRINAIVYENTLADKFVTFFCGILQMNEDTLYYINAGHNPPLLRRSNSHIEELSTGGLLLGIMESTPPFEEGNISFYAGDLLMMYTDGVSEAMNKQREEYGEARLREFIRALDVASANASILQLIDDVKRYVGGAAQSDDITLLAVYRKR